MTNKGVKEIWISPHSSIESSTSNSVDNPTEWWVEVHFHKNVREWFSIHYSKQEVKEFLKGITVILSSFPVEQAEICLQAWEKHLETLTGEFCWPQTP